MTLPKSKTLVRPQWDYTIKNKKNGDKQYLARFVVKGTNTLE